MRLLLSVVLWLVYFVPSLLIELVCYILAPIVALFVRYEDRLDIVKRFNRKSVLMEREYLIKPLRWFQTHDNAADEWFWGMYNEDHWFKFAREATQAHYASSPTFRWYCRLMWLWRNCGYGFLYNLLGSNIERHDKVKSGGVKHSGGFWWQFIDRGNNFQLEAQIPFIKGRHVNINVGWKVHKGFPRALYANRFLGFRKNKKG